MKRIAVLGSTGSIGRSTLDVIAEHPEKFSVFALSANSSIDLIEEQIQRFHPKFVAIVDEGNASELQKRLGSGTKIVSGVEGLIAVSTHPQADMVLVGTSGHEALIPLIRALESGKKVALASKELLVMAGEHIMRLVREKNSEFIPVDSEHSALFQLLRGISRDAIKEIIITGSGGSLWSADPSHIHQASVDEVLCHPKWNMGPKITVDSATLMNKGLEVIEAHWLFGFPIENIKVLIHPQAVFHGILELLDGTCFAHAGICDMKLPIQYALSFPERWGNPAGLGRVEWHKIPPMEFHEPDLDRFPCLALAIEALRTGGTACAVLSAANDIAVAAFLKKEISFGSVPYVIEKTLAAHKVLTNPTLDEIVKADQWARETARTNLMYNKKVFDAAV
jgi:1-deoxy-D-xylulose-5-phosphate reductoisomerase